MLKRDDKIELILSSFVVAKESLKHQQEMGIISRADAEIEEAMIKSKETAVKTRAVREVHVKSNGKPRSIRQHDPTDCYLHGYWYTKVEGGKTFKAKTEEDLYCKLYDYYFGDDTSIVLTVSRVHELALEEKRITENPSANTIRKNQADYNRFIDDDFSKKDIRKITAEDLKRYTQSLVTSKSLKKQAYLSYKGVLNLIFGYAVRHRIIKENPVTALNNRAYLKSCDTSKSKADERIFSEAEIDDLVAEIKRRMTMKKYGDYYINGYAMQFAILTGVRVGELCALKWGDVDCENNLIHIHAQQLTRQAEKGLDYYYVPYCKNERGISEDGRFYPLTDEIYNLLRELRDKQDALGIQSEYIFCHKDGEWIKTLAYESFVRRICKSMGLSATSNHAFRRSLNSNVFLQNNISVADRAALLGHSIETNLRHYSYAPKDYLDSVRGILNDSNRQKVTLLNEKELFSTVEFPKRKSLESANS